MEPGIIECVPNLSEGRDPRAIAIFAERVRERPGVELLDYSGDADHNRSVFTFIGSPNAVIEAALSLAREAVDRIDLNRHTGVHPRIGAVDVVPFVPVAGTRMEDCARVATEFAHQLWAQLRVPSFLYEQAAVRPEYRNLEEVRRCARGGAPPDIGEARHPTAGACAVGARDFLIAWNIWLDTPAIEIAKRIARAVRFSSGGFPGVKALGLPLRSRGIVQVSINSTDFRSTPLHMVFEAASAVAAQAGVRVRGSELIGMIPQSALDLSAGHDLRWLNLAPARIIRQQQPTMSN